MIYIFKCKNEKCDAYDKEVEVEQRITDEHIAFCELCGEEMKRVFTTFTIGVPQGWVTKDGIRMPARRAREIDRRREKKARQGGVGPYWDNPKRRLEEE